MLNAKCEAEAACGDAGVWNGLLWVVGTAMLTPKVEAGNAKPPALAVWVTVDGDADWVTVVAASRPDTGVGVAKLRGGCVPNTSGSCRVCFCSATAEGSTFTAVAVVEVFGENNRRQQSWWIVICYKCPYCHPIPSKHGHTTHLSTSWWWFGSSLLRNHKHMVHHPLWKVHIQ